jgi:iron(III) transport system ATP-binding protein
MVFQDYALFPHMTVGENIAFGIPHLDASERTRTIDRVLGLVGLSGLAHRRPHELSGGQQQRIALARALAPQPAVILLDEPFSSIDAALRARVRADVRDILAEAGATAMFVTHDQEEALSIADKVAVMWAGKLLQIDRPEAIYRAPATREVAQFVGGMDMIPGEARDGAVDCELGRLPLAGDLAGPVEVFIPPENVQLVPTSEGASRVVRREFFGHDQRYAAALPSGRVIRSWATADLDLDIGQPVDVEISSPVLAFAAPTGVRSRSSPAPAH